MLPLRILGFIVLIFSLCDADSLCPTDLNPLTLDPPEVIREYKEQVLVNCTSTEEDHEGMYWTVGNTDSPMEYDSNYIDVPLSNWMVSAECKIMLNDTHKCSKDLEITVYKNPETVTVFSTSYTPTVEGTLFELQCDINDVAPVQNLIVRWYKNNQAIKNDSFTNTTKTPVSESSTLAVNISRDENGAKFRCEAQLDFGPHGSQPVISDTYTVAVHYGPELKNKTEDVYVNEDSDVTLTCDAEGHPPPHFHWTCDGLNISENTNKLNITRVITSTTCNCTATNKQGSVNKQIHVHVMPILTAGPAVMTPRDGPELKNKTEDVYVNEDSDVTLTCDAEGHPPLHFHWTCDGLNISENTNKLNITRVITSTTCNCTATNDLGSVNKQINVHVMPIPTAAPAVMTTRGCPIVVTPSDIVVRFGDPASVNCSTDADVQQMGWETPVGAISTGDPVVIWKVEKLEYWQITPLCFINLNDNYQCSKKLTITVYKAPDSVSVSALADGPMVEGTEYHLICDIINVAPVQKLKVTWYRNNEPVHTEVFNKTSKVPVTVSSTLRVTPVGDYNGAHFICKADLQLGQNRPETDPTVTSSAYMAVVHYKPVLKACPKSYPGVEHEFSLDKLSCLADGNPPPIVKWYFGEALINASEPLTRAQSGIYTAKFTNDLGSSNTSVLITIEYGPSFNCEDHYKVKENGKLQCEPEGIPTPTITWSKDGKEIVSPQRWTKYDSGNYSLSATNTHGTTFHKLHLEVLYAPVFKEEKINKEVNLGDNVTIDCIAEGNPVPNIEWNYSRAVNVKETRGRQKNISITGATSTNTGVYSCVATNEVGKETRSVTLTVKGSTSAVFSKAIWWLLIILIVVLILIILISVHNRCKKKGQYTFVPDKVNDGSEIPMTPQSKGVQA